MIHIQNVAYKNYIKLYIWKIYIYIYFLLNTIVYVLICIIPEVFK